MVEEKEEEKEEEEGEEEEGEEEEEEEEETPFLMMQLKIPTREGFFEVPH